MKSGILSYLLLFSVFISACNSSSKPAGISNGEQTTTATNDTSVQSPASEAENSGTGGNLFGPKWVIGEMNGKEVMVAEGKGQQPYITFSQNDQRVQGNGGCNSFSASFTSGPSGKLQLKGLVSTRMACESLSLEDEYFKMLEKVDALSVEADVLSFFDAKQQPLARFKSGN